MGKGQPFLNSAKGVVNQIVGNWKISGNGGAQSGLPFQAYTGSATGFPDNTGKIRPNIVPGVEQVLPNWLDNCNNAITQRCPYINTLAVFSAPAALTVGNATRVMDNIRMPHTVFYNMAILKDIPIHEKIRLAFRMEMYGALNHVTFSANQNNFTLYTGLNYAGVVNPTVTAANINTSYADVGTNIGGNRTMQMGLKLYF